MDPAFFSVPSGYGRAPRVVPEAAPPAIVTGGLVRLGMFDAPVRNMNLTASKLLSRSGRLIPPVFLEWVGAGIAHPDWYLGLIVVDAKLASLAVLYGYNRKTGAYFSHDRPGLRSRVKVAGSTWNDVTRYEGRGFRIEILHRLEEGRHDVTVDIAASGKKPAVKGSLLWREPLGRMQPLVLMSPIDGGGFIYNHKAQMPVEGELRIGREAVRFSPERDIANMDDLKLRPTGSGLAYRWFNFGGFDPKGRLIGVDLAHADRKPDPYWAENCLWAGEKLWLCDEVEFEVDRKDPMKPWRASDRKGNIDITFHPEGGKKVGLEPIAIYHQKCGRFRGKITAGDGEVHEIRDYYGCAELANIFT